MPTFIRIDQSNQLISQAQQQMAANRFLQQERLEQQAAERQIAQALTKQRQAPTSSGSFWQGKRQKGQAFEEVAVFARPGFVEAPTVVTAKGSYLDQSLTIDLEMTTHRNAGRIRNGESVITSASEIYKDSAKLIGAGSSPGFGFSYSALNCSSISPYFPNATTPGQWLDPFTGTPTATPTSPTDLLQIRLMHNWLDVNVFDETRQGGSLGIVYTVEALLGLSAQPGDFCLLLVEGPSYGYYIYDPYLWPSRPTNPIDQSKKIGNWYYYFYTGEIPNPVLVGPKNPFPTSLLASPFYGEIRWRLYVIVIYEVEDNAAVKLRYTSPVPSVIACLATESRSQQINIIYPLDYVAGYRSVGIRNAISYNLATFGKFNNGVAWGQKRAENIARFVSGDPPIAEGDQPSNIFFSGFQSIVIQNYQVITWGNTKFDPAGEPEPEVQPAPRLGSYNAILKDPRQ